MWSATMPAERQRPDRAVLSAHQAIGDVLRTGDLAIDATAGNGHDTVFLAARVGPAGHVFAFDVQAEALSNTRERLESTGGLAWTSLIHASHAEMDRHISKPCHGRIRAVMFNLGYRPGSDKSVVTRPATTIAALDRATKLLMPGGRLSIVAYPGHVGGMEETFAVMEWIEQLPSQGYLSTPEPARSQRAPRLLIVAVREAGT